MSEGIRSVGRVKSASKKAGDVLLGDGDFGDGDVEGAAKATAVGLRAKNALLHAGALMGGATKTMGSKLASAFGATSSAVGAVFNVGSTTASLLTGGSLAGVGAAGLLGLSSLLGTANVGVLDTMPEDCLNAADANLARYAGAMDVADADKEDVAKKIYSVVKGMGGSDEQAAGIIGNFETESELTPYMVEGMAGKGAAASIKAIQDRAEMDRIVNEVLKPAYAGKPINWAFYHGADGHWYPGIGLGQWTGQDQVSKAIKWGEDNCGGIENLECQLGLIFADKAPEGGLSDKANVKRAYMSKDFSSPEDAAQYWGAQWEGNTTFGYPERLTNAAKWYTKMADWEADTSFADSVLALAKTANNHSLAKAGSDEMRDCVKAMSGGLDNSSIAKAALSYTWSNKEQSRNNGGTIRYQDVREFVTHGGKLYSEQYADCGANSGTAVLWSGSDDSFPNKSTAAILPYGSSSPKWEVVTSHYTDDMYDQLRPGDIFVYNSGGGGHTFVFVGHDAVEEMKSLRPDLANVPDCTDVVEASWNGIGATITEESRSPGLVCLNGGTDADGNDDSSASPNSSAYTVLRFKGPAESNSQYSSFKSDGSVTETRR